VGGNNSLEVVVMIVGLSEELMSKLFYDVLFNYAGDSKKMVDSFIMEIDTESYEIEFNRN
jgi:hypothetical protein